MQLTDRNGENLMLTTIEIFFFGHFSTLLPHCDKKRKKMMPKTCKNGSPKTGAHLNSSLALTENRKKCFYPPASEASMGVY